MRAQAQAQAHLGRLLPGVVVRRAVTILMCRSRVRKTGVMGHPGDVRVCEVRGRLLQERGDAGSSRGPRVGQARRGAAA